MGDIATSMRENAPSDSRNDEIVRLRAELAGYRAREAAVLEMVGAADGECARDAVARFRQTADAMKVVAQDEIARLAGQIHQVISQRDAFQEFIDRIAVEMGCERESTNMHDHRACVAEKAGEMREAWTVIESWIREHEPLSAEALYQVDSCHQAAPELVVKLCEIVGWYREPTTG